MGDANNPECAEMEGRRIIVTILCSHLIGLSLCVIATHLEQSLPHHISLFEQ